MHEAFSVIHYYNHIREQALLFTEAYFTYLYRYNTELFFQCSRGHYSPV